jgi:hypothetical protein
VIQPVLPRYSVGSVTGWSIPANGTAARYGRYDRPPPTIWYVHDRLVGYHVVEEHIAFGGKQTPARNPEVRARKRCDELNAEYMCWLRDQGALP